MRDRGRALGALAARHALGLRGGAGGVEHDGPGIGRCVRRCIRRLAAPRARSKRNFVGFRRLERNARAILACAECTHALRRDWRHNTTAFASEFSIQEIEFVRSARQFTGVRMTPVNWQAQCRVAACHRFGSTVSK